MKIKIGRDPGALCVKGLGEGGMQELLHGGTQQLLRRVCRFSASTCRFLLCAGLRTLMQGGARFAQVIAENTQT